MARPPTQAPIALRDARRSSPAATWAWGPSAFAREGANVAINYHPDEEPDAHDVADLLEAEGLKIGLLPGDIRDERRHGNLSTG